MLRNTKGWRMNVRRGGKVLRDLREGIGATQFDIYNATGIAPQLQSRYENGVSMKVNLEDVVKLFGAFDKTPDEAALAYEVWVPHIPLGDRRLDEVAYIVDEFIENPAARNRLLDMLLHTARVFRETEKTPA